MNLKDMEHKDKMSYLKYSFEKNIIYFRPVIVLCIFLYAMFGIIDYYFYPEYLEIFLISRFLVVIPLFLLTIFISYGTYFEKIYEYVIVFIYIVGGLGIVLMINFIEGYNYYYGGLYLIFSAAFFMLRLKPELTLSGAYFLLFSLIVLASIMDNVNRTELYVEVVFYVSFTFLGFLGSKNLEKYRIHQFFQEKCIIGENVVLEKKVFEQFEDIKNYHSATIIAIARLAESRDEFTGGHINRVGELAYRLAKKLSYKFYNEHDINRDAFVDAIKLSSSLHDIGKISISDLLLNKPGKLTAEEFEKMKEHTTIGYNMLLSIQNDIKDNIFLSLGLNISKSHHERWDGTGYPNGLSKDEIPIEARIVSLIDVYDALVSERSYKKAFSKTKSLNLIKDGIGTQFDPEIGRVFIKLAQETNDEELFGKD